MKKYIALLALLIAACGGGGGFDIDVPPPTSLRADLYYSYYLTSPTQVAETVKHVNMIWVGGPFGIDAGIASMQAARLPAVLDINAQMYGGTGHGRFLSPTADADLRAVLSRLDSLGLLQYVAALYPLDEPDIAASNPADILAANTIVRRVASEFPALAGVPLAVIYAGGARLTHVEDFDWVGFDDYDAKSSILTGGEYAGLVARLRPDQRTMLVPGGAYLQDPTPFMNWAQRDPRVVAVVPFLWTDTTDFPGIRSLSIRNAYCLAGEQIETPGKTGACQ